MRIIRSIALLLALLWAQTARASATNDGFNLIVVGDPQPQTEAQLSQLENHIIPQIGAIVQEYLATGYPTAILLTGDVVWDTMEFLPRVRAAFESLGVPVYAVIGNHDHNRRIRHNQPRAEREYISAFGPRNQSFVLGRTLFVTLDNIDYSTYKEYRSKVDNEQLQWLTNIINQHPDNLRIAVCMHAPASNVYEAVLRPYAEPIVEAIGARKIDFITGHSHRHATAVITPDITEHNVAQVNGNLWYAPICADGTPQGVFCIEERGGEWQWQHRILGKEADYQLRAWHLGEVSEHEEFVVVKVIGWDDKWSIEWSENGVHKGEMEQIKIVDPDYMYYVDNEADYRKKYMKRLYRSARPHSHYYRCRPSSKNSEIFISATDRFGREFSTTIKASK